VTPAEDEYLRAITEILTIFDDDPQMTADLNACHQLTAEADALARIRVIGRRVMEGRGTVSGRTPAGHAEAAEIALSRHFPVAVEIAEAQVHALLAINGQIEAFGGTLARALLASAAEHPPVPEQAITPAMAAVIEDNADLWAGWQPGYWPVHDPLDPRRFRWADPLDEGA
jgi:hypothetical protein